MGTGIQGLGGFFESRVAEMAQLSVSGCEIVGIFSKTRGISCKRAQSCLVRKALRVIIAGRISMSCNTLDDAQVSRAGKPLPWKRGCDPGILGNMIQGILS